MHGSVIQAIAARLRPFSTAAGGWWLAVGVSCWLAGGVYRAEAEELRSGIAIGLLVSPEPTEAASMRRGAAVAIERANRTAGAPVRLAVRGRPGQWGTEGDEAAALALDEAVDVMITPADGSAAHQVLQVAGRTRLPVASLCADTSVTRAGVPWVVRIVPSTLDEAKALFTGLADRSRPVRWAALVPAERAGREAARDLTEAAAALGLSWPEPLRLPPAAENRKGVLDQVLAGHPDVVLLWTDPGTAGELARELCKAGFKGRLAGPSRLRSTTFLRNAGLAAEGVVVPALLSEFEEGGHLGQFRQEYRQRYSSEPDSLALMAHDAALVMIGLLRKSTPATLLQRFPVSGTYCGASGRIQFDQNGNRLGTLALMICREGQFETWPHRPSPGPVVQ